MVLIILTLFLEDVPTGKQHLEDNDIAYQVHFLIILIFQEQIAVCCSFNRLYFYLRLLSQGNESSDRIHIFDNKGHI